MKVPIVYLCDPVKNTGGFKANNKLYSKGLQATVDGYCNIWDDMCEDLGLT